MLFLGATASHVCSDAAMHSIYYDLQQSLFKHSFTKSSNCIIIARVLSPVTYNCGGMNHQVSLNSFIASLKVACIFHRKQIFTKINEVHQLRNYYSLYYCNMTY